MPSSDLQDFVPRKTSFGARLIASHDASLPAGLRRLLLLADGQRTVFTLMQMLPDRDVLADLRNLAQRGLLEDASRPEPEYEPMDASGEDPDLPEGWDSASDFMVSRARESLGVMAVDVIHSLEHANDQEAAREAMTQWYRAMRGSREGREKADLDRLKAALILGGKQTA
jgi:hypothetical protein